MRKHLFASIVLVSLVIAFRAWAGFDEGVQAYKRGDYATAYTEFLPLALAGGASAQYNLGLMYDTGRGVPQDYVEAAKWYRRAAEQGDTDAQYNLGVMYAKGKGVPQDYAQALTWFYRAAEQGDASAQYNLGLMYAHGQGMPQDDAQAAQWYRRAAAQGHASAQHNLGVMYAQGQGVPQDYAQAVQWFRRAAAQGHASAQGNLGLIYDTGKGVPQDYAQAYFWLSLAAARMPPGPTRDKAVHNRDSVAALLTSSQLAHAQALARTWEPKPELSPGTTPGFLRPPRMPPPQPQTPLVWRVQERLKAEGFNPGVVDGLFGAKTRDALRQFQNTKGLRPTGELDNATLNALGVR